MFPILATINQEYHGEEPIGRGRRMKEQWFRKGGMFMPASKVRRDMKELTAAKLENGSLVGMESTGSIL